MNLRNVAIIAHVDHGKTTLVDRLLQQSGSFRDNQKGAERAMESNDLERERGITILAKATSILYQDTRINIVDTPGHADFGGEVERILNMVDGALVLVDAAEGPQEEGMKPLFDLVLRHVKQPTVEDGPFRLLGTILEANPYLGRIVTGRIASGTVKPNQPVKVLSRDGKLVETGRISKILAFRGIERTPVDVAEAGDIVAIAGLTKGTVADTFCDMTVDAPIQAQPIDPPTVSMSFIVNNSPLAGTEGDKVTSRLIRDRLLREAEGNVALKVVEAADKDAMEVSGRGELQLAILIETMRREGFELSVSRPRVVLTKNDNGQLLEPIEEVVIDVDEEFSGVVVQKMSERKAELIEMKPSGGNRLRLVFYAPTRGLIGYQSELLTDTKGTAIMNRLFHDYLPYKGEIQGRRNGVLLSNDQGEAVAYAMFKLEDRGPMMIEPGWRVYRGMIVGEHTRDNDLEINVLKGKQLTNIRTTSKDEAVRLTPPIRMTLEKALAYIEADELVAITPTSIRMSASAQKRAGKRSRADRFFTENIPEMPGLVPGIFVSYVHHILTGPHLHVPPLSYRHRDHRRGRRRARCGARAAKLRTFDADIGSARSRRRALPNAVPPRQRDLRRRLRLAAFRRQESVRDDCGETRLRDQQTPTAVAAADLRCGFPTRRARRIPGGAGSYLRAGRGCRRRRQRSPSKHH